jgi:hypothetical protein
MDHRGTPRAKKAGKLLYFVPVARPAVKPAAAMRSTRRRPPLCPAAAASSRVSVVRNVAGTSTVM